MVMYDENDRWRGINFCRKGMGDGMRFAISGRMSVAFGLN